MKKLEDKIPRETYLTYVRGCICNMPVYVTSCYQPLAGSRVALVTLLTMVTYMAIVHIYTAYTVHAIQASSPYIFNIMLPLSDTSGHAHICVTCPYMPGWNPCKPHAEDAPRLSKYHAKVFGMTPQKPKTKQNTPSTSTIYAGTRQNLRSHASTPRISKLHAEDLRRDIHRFHPGIYVIPHYHHM